MRTSISTRQPGKVEAEITRVVFGAWAVCRNRSTDQIEGWIDPAGLRGRAADLDEIASAIKLSGFANPVALAA
jgi:hypothetical protein